MRSRALLAGVVAMMVATFGCADKPDPVQLFQIQVGDTVYADVWHDKGDEGDQALVELKLDDKTWVIDLYVEVRPERSDRFDVEIKRTKDAFIIVDMGDTRTGIDHDRCVDPKKEHLVTMEDTSYKEEPAVASDDTSDDDCVDVKEAA